MKIIILDEIPLITYAVKHIILKKYPYYIIETFTDVEDLKFYFTNNQSDILFVDIEIKNKGGLKYLRDFHNKFSEMKIIVLTNNSDMEHIFSAIKYGANAYLLKNEVDEKLIIKALERVIDNQEFFSDTISNIILRNYVNNLKQGEEISQKKPRNLTRREIQILRLVCEGLTNKQIAEGLYISVRTVDAHKNHIMQKLGLKTTAQLIKYAIKHGYVDL